jgi:hypothetical protein
MPAFIRVLFLSGRNFPSVCPLLFAPQLRIEAAGGNKVIVFSPFNDPPFVDHQDLVGMADRPESVEPPSPTIML